MNDTERAYPEPRMLVVDGDASALAQTMVVLREAGCVLVRGVSDASPALQVFRDWSPDVMVADARVPGLETVRRIQAQRPILVIIIAASVDRDVIVDACDVEVMAFFIKPLRFADVLTALPVALARFRDCMDLRAGGAEMRKEPVQDHLFEPFFTAKPVGKGTGLGLSISRDIVTEFGGEGVF